ncbi:MAG: hypothetical protein PHH31_08555 [Acidaminococcaceae bacterium]|nr:hypothetical protein [Acidaminococcaceae bacterium]MDD4722104.1 hypothetical protein [Acidaminococcaceae bacterium]
MMGQKKGVCDQIKTLQSNLKNAEESFRAHNGARGELDLMLAEAQMKFLREKRGTKSFWARETFALTLALILVLVGVGSWFLAKSTLPVAGNALATQVLPISNEVQQAEMPVSMVRQAQRPVLDKNVSVAAKSSNVAEYSAAKVEEPIPEKTQAPTEVKVRNTSFAETKEIRNLVRVARKKLSEVN